jgi:3-oxoacyl-[acyl-carrier-protein] synthase II
LLSTQPERVVITGIGAITPVGNTVEQSRAAIARGQSSFGPLTLFDANAIEPKVVAEVKSFDPASYFGSKESRRMDRCTQLALAATQQALFDAAFVIDDDHCHNIGVIIGSAVGGLGTLLSEDHVMFDRGVKRVSPSTVPMR